MANTAKIDDEELAKLSEGPAGSPIYLQQQRRALERFETHLRNNEDSTLEKVLKDDQKLEKALKLYFFGIWVCEFVPDEAVPGKFKKTDKMVPPKIGYAKNVKSVLFGVLARRFKVQYGTT